ncbi:MAG: hypothetical protein WA040_02360 [Anaerolineae bacterium]
MRQKSGFFRAIGFLARPPVTNLAQFFEHSALEALLRLRASGAVDASTNGTDQIKQHTPDHLASDRTPPQTGEFLFRLLYAVHGWADCAHC